MASITPLERLIIVTARRYLVANAKTAEEEMETYKLPFTAQDALVAEANPWCDHWLYAKIENEHKAADKKPPSYADFQKALMSLIKKKYLKAAWSDRYILIVEATRYVK